MSDLIDLTSPENKKVSAGTKLSSPLIPLPANLCVDSSQLMPNTNLECRRIIDNNPFDIELQKTNEFMSKSEDPFEVVWQKANNVDELVSHSTEFKKPSSCIHLKDDPNLKQKKSFDTKMNRTLDNSLINADISSISKIKHPASTNNANDVLLNLNEYQLSKQLENEELYEKNKASKFFDNLPSSSLNPPSPDFNNLSILNQSVMNDSFSLCSPTRRDSIDNAFNLLTSCTKDLPNDKESLNQHNTSILNQSAMNDSLSGSSGCDTGLIKSIVARRIAMCIEKGMAEAETELKIPEERYHRLRRSFSQGDQLSFKNFYQLHSQSAIDGSRLQILNDRSIPAILHEDKFNKGFIRESSDDNTTTLDVSAISSIRRIRSVTSTISSDATTSIKNLGFINDTISSTRTTSNGNRSIDSYPRHLSTSSLAEISDLVAKFDRLKAKTLRQSLSMKCSVTDSDQEIFNEQQNTTSDSVFFDIKPTKQSISSDELVNSLKKCSLKAHYGSDTSSEYSLPKRPPSAMELLPNTESPPSNHNSGVSDNLIELQTSNASKDQSDSDRKVNSVSSNVQEKNDDKTNIDIAKEFDKELIEPEKKLTAATLLMELEKLVNNENNPKAVELLENLEQVLGVKCDNNVELLEMFVQNTEAVNEVENNPENDVAPFEKSQISTVDISNEDNTNVDLSHGLPPLNCENFCTNSNNSQMNVKNTINRNDKLSKVNDCYITSPHKSTTKHPKSPIDKPQNLFNTQKLVIDVQIALQKLLTSNNSDPMAFLKSLNKVLNPSSNEPKVELEKDNQAMAIPARSIPTPPSKKLETSHLSTKSSTMRRSIHSTSTLKKSTTMQRRSSISQIVKTSNECNTKIKTRIDSPKKMIPKRSSSDSDFFDNTKVAKKISDPIKLKPSVPIVNKKKLRTNNDTTDRTIKKGPLKAFLPMGNMQQCGSSEKKVSPLIIPPFSPSNCSYDNSSALMGITSTPNPDAQINLDTIKNSPKRKPVASSTPDINSKISRVKLPTPRSPKHNISWNISPVTPNESKISTPNKNLFFRKSPMNRSQQMSKKQMPPKLKNLSSSMQMDKTTDGLKKKSILPRDQLFNKSEGKLRCERRSEPVKNTLSIKKITSPMKENNTPGKKINSLNLRRSATKPMEKENKWK